jgi:hypothetical protein
MQMLISILYSAVIIGLGTSQLIDMQAAKSEADFREKEKEALEARLAEAQQMHEEYLDQGVAEHEAGDNPFDSHMNQRQTEQYMEV